MRLNGWKRIGIVASLVWILAGGYYKLSAMDNDVTSTAGALIVSCEESQNMRWSAACDKEGEDYVTGMDSVVWANTAAFALIPVPIGWGFAYLAIFVVQWVKRGFAPSRS